jgi:uncharacterized protein YbjT (DUF2867 family)
MTNAPSNALVLAGTGKTGSRVAAKLTKLGLSVRTAARNSADEAFGRCPRQESNLEPSD